MIATCPTHATLQSLSLGKLEESHSDELVLHLQHCELCQNEIQKIDSVQDTFVSNLRNGARETDEYSDEVGLKLAATLALASLANVNQDSLPKSVGEYEIVEPLGGGGMGQVYLARHTKLQRQVAIKVLADHRRWDQTMHERFASEMRAIGALNHPNIVVAHDAREVDGLAVLVTEYIAGMDLGAILRREEKLPIADACKVIVETCNALEYCQTKGLVHRDIKPSNIMIDTNGNVKLLDLGLARLHDSDGSSQREFTATGHAIGTADYVAPEQINDSRNVDARTDLYSLGCTFFKLLTGQPPFASAEFASSFAKMNAHVSEAAPSVRALRADVPAAVDALIAKMLAKAPADRPTNAAEVRVVAEQFSRDADLQELVLAAQTKPMLDALNDASLQNTAASVQPQGSSKMGSGRRWIGWVCAIGLAGLFGFWLGVILTVKKPDGSTTQVEIPDGSTAVVDADGNVEITIAGTGQKVALPLVTQEPAESKVRAPETKNHFGKFKRAKYVIHLLPDHPLFGCLEPGDEVDMIARDLSGSNKPDRLFYPKQTVSSVRGDEKGQVIEISVPVLPKDALKKRKSLGDDIAITLAMHDPNRQLRHDEEKINGVWKLALMKFGGKVIPLPNDLAILFFNGKVVSVPDGVGPFIDPYRMQAGGKIELPSFFDHAAPVGGYRFLPSGNLELSFKVPDNGMRMHLDDEKFVRLTRVETPNTKAQQKAFEILESAKTGKRKIVIRILNDEKEPLMDSPIVASNGDFVEASVGEDNGHWQINFRLIWKASQKMKQITAANIGNLMGIFVDGKLICSPKIHSAIGGEGMISGAFSKEEAKSIVESIVPKLTFRGKEIERSPSPGETETGRNRNGKN